VRIIGFQILNRKESLELSTTLAEARSLRMAVSTLVERVNALIASKSVAKKPMVKVKRKGRK
jgi:hypothetical protein